MLVLSDFVMIVAPIDHTEQSIFIFCSSITSKDATGTRSSGSVGGSARNSQNRPRCTFCSRWGHVRDKCFKLHGKPPRANVLRTST